MRFTLKKYQQKLQKNSDQVQLAGDMTLNPFLPDVPEGIPAAVLIPVIDRPEGQTILLTERAAHLSVHPGQISFPGGRWETCDVSLEKTALRETFEEVGILEQEISVIGALPNYKTRTEYMITPIVGLVKPNYSLRIQEEEVASVFELPLTFLRNNEFFVKKSRLVDSMQAVFYEGHWNKYRIWGATAAMLVNFKDIFLGSEEI